MPIRTGIDLVEVGRLAGLREGIRKRFLKRVFTPLELEQTGEEDERLAGRFAVKEAAAKALGTGIGPVSFQEIEVRLAENGQPRLYLSGKAKEISESLGLSDWSVSITHTTDLAMAVVIASGTGSLKTDKSEK